MWQSIISATHWFCQAAAEARIRDSDIDSIFKAIRYTEISLVEDFVTADRSIVLKADYNEDLYRTPLHCAIRERQWYVRGDDDYVSLEDEEKARRSFEIVLFLINSKADVNARESRFSGGEEGVYPLWLACNVGDPKVCRLLVDSKADVAATNVPAFNFFQTALRQAHRSSAFEIIDYLRSLGAPNCQKDDDEEEHEHTYAHTCQFYHRPW